MKRKILITGVLAIIVLGAIGYGYLSRDHKDIATASVDYTLTTEELATAFQKDEEQAIATYLNAVIEVQGTVISASEEVIELSAGISAQLQDPFTKSEKGSKDETQITLRGRCIGYDSLLEEVRLDQAFIIQ